MTRERTPMTPEHARYLKRYRRRTQCIAPTPLPAGRADSSPSRLSNSTCPAGSFSLADDLPDVELPKWDADGRRIITTVEKIRQNDLKRELKNDGKRKESAGRRLMALLSGAIFRGSERPERTPMKRWAKKDPFLYGDGKAVKS